MGNQFLNDLINADVLIQVVDISGKTDITGNKSSGSDPYDEVVMIREEMARWVSGIIMKHIDVLARTADGEKALHELLSGFKVTVDQIRIAANQSYLTLTNINWGEKDCYKFSQALMKVNKPMIVAANKLDQASNQQLENLKAQLKDVTVIGCSAAMELALRKAAKAGAIDYASGASEFTMKKEVSNEQKSALSYVAKYIKANNGTGIQELLNAAIFSVLKELVVYPVEDENKYTDHFGNVLPDAILMPEGSTAHQLAAKIHTDLANSMKYAVDAKTKMRLQKNYVLKENDVIKIVSH